MNIKKYVKYIPSSIRYNHYLHKVIFFKNNFWYYVKLKSFSNIDLSCNYISLTVGSSYQLPVKNGDKYIWHSDNKNVSVNEVGMVTALNNALGKESNAVITAIYEDKEKYKYRITIVDWIANQSYLEIKQILPKYKILAKEENKIYFSISKALYYSIDGFKTKNYISKLPIIPAANPPMLITPFGYFLTGQKRIIWSDDLLKWKTVQKINMNGVIHSFDYYNDENDKKCYVYFSEYSCKSNNRHKVYQCIIDKEKKQSWKVILDFNSINEYENNKKIFLNSARHIHLVTVDEFTGHVWVGTGDEDIHAKILYSMNNGNSFQILGMGSQEWRTLSIWFTEKYVYWNMDSHEPQKIFRINKKFYLNKIDNEFISIQDINQIENAKKEIVAKLYNGAMFSHCDFYNENGERIIIMSVAPEGSLRDMQGRVFGIQELPDESVIVQELVSVSPKNINAPYETNMFTQLVPIVQDEEEYMYLKTRNLIYDGIVKAKLVWHNLKVNII